LLDTLKIPDVPISISAALNERNYGIYTGLNKWKAKDELGEKVFEQIRRGWNYPIAEGETLEDVYKRIVPYYQERILPRLRENENVLVVSHNNSLRALIKYIEDLSVQQLEDFELGTGEVYMYSVNADGKMITKETRAANPEKRGA
jgi:2,3-bisphosphoglycerate-dependent phosphoglycerate mutase